MAPPPLKKFSEPPFIKQDKINEELFISFTRPAQGRASGLAAAAPAGEKI